MGLKDGATFEFTAEELDERDKKYRSYLRERMAENGRERSRLRSALCDDYIRYKKEFPDKDDDEIRKMISQKREVSLVVVNNAIASQGNGLSAKARVELEAKIMVHTERQLASLDVALSAIENVISKVCTSDDTHFEIERTEEEGGRTGDSKKKKLIPRDEYLMRLTREYIRTARDAADTIRAFQGNKNETNVNVGVVISESQREERMRGVRELYEVKIKEPKTC